MDWKTYSNRSNAVRAWKGLVAKLPEHLYPNGSPETDVVLEADTADTRVYRLRLSLDCARKDVDEEALELLAGHEFVCERPDYDKPESSPENPLLGERSPMKPFDQWERSAIETPVAFCWEVFNRYLARGEQDCRKAAVRECVDSGVAKNTASTQYRLWREKKGLPVSVRKAKGQK